MWYAMADPLDDRKAIAAWAAMYGLEKADPRVLRAGCLFAGGSSAYSEPNAGMEWLEICLSE